MSSCNILLAAKTQAGPLGQATDIINHLMTTAMMIDFPDTALLQP
jgi:hypothetical protein